jgi:hypothetical protein
MTVVQERPRTARTGARIAAVVAALVLGLLAAKLAARGANALVAGPDTAAVAAVAAGWTVGDGIPDSAAFFATKGDTRAAVYGTVMDPVGFTTFTDVGAVQPWWVSLIALGCGLGGALLGALTAGWLARRALRRSSAGRAGVRELTVIGFVLLIPFTVQTALQVVADASRAEQPWQPSSTLLDLARWPGALGVLLLLIALAAAATRDAP